MDKRLERIKEIENERNKLAVERDSLRAEIAKEKLDKKKLERDTFLGKYYKLAPGNSHFDNNQNVKAFKILSFGENLDYAKCLTIIDGRGSTCWTEKGIIVQVLGLWFYADNRLMHSEGDKKLIDCFIEIDEEEFNSLKQEMLENLDC